MFRSEVTDTRMGSGR